MISVYPLMSEYSLIMAEAILENYKISTNPQQADVLLVIQDVNAETVEMAVNIYEHMLAPKYIIWIHTDETNPESYLPVDIVHRGAANEQVMRELFDSFTDGLKSKKFNGWHRYLDQFYVYKDAQRTLLESEGR